jgi:hypothetical protein
LKNDVNVPSKSKKQNNEKSRIPIGTKMSRIRSIVLNNGLESASFIFLLNIESVSPDNLQKLHQQGMKILAPDRIKALAEHLPLIKVRPENVRFFNDHNIKKKYISEKTVQNSLGLKKLPAQKGTCLKRYRYCPARCIWLKVGSFHRSSFKGAQA